MFSDRQQAGELLGKALAKYKGQSDVVVVALPRGGVVVGRAVADALSAPLEIVVPRKIGFPGHEEYAIGAITETGEAVWNEEEKRRIPDIYRKEAVAREKTEAKRRLDTYQAGRPARNLKDKIVILVDDGIATGYTTEAAIKTIRSEGPKKIVLAVPVAPAETVAKLRQEVDEVLVLEQPDPFWAIGAHFENFGQVDDETVMRLLRT